MIKTYIIAIIILLLAIISALIIIYRAENSMENIENIATNQTNSTMEEVAIYLNSSDELKADTATYKTKYLMEFRNIFDNLNDNTNILLDALLDSKNDNLEKLISYIKSDEEKLFILIDNAINNAKSNQYKLAYTSLKKYIKLQNETIYNLVDVYKKEGSLSYDTYYEMLHNTHGTLTPADTNGINFLAAVDKLIEENN